jgi:hypothetical protein
VSGFGYLLPPAGRAPKSIPCNPPGREFGTQTKKGRKGCKRFVARRMKTSRSTLVKFIYTRGLLKKETEIRPA